MGYLAPGTNFFLMFHELSYKNYEIQQQEFLGESRIFKGSAKLEVHLEIIALALQAP